MNISRCSTVFLKVSRESVGPEAEGKIGVRRGIEKGEGCVIVQYLDSTGGS